MYVISSSHDCEQESEPICITINNFIGPNSSLKTCVFCNVIFIELCINKLKFLVQLDLFLCIMKPLSGYKSLIEWFMKSFFKILCTDTHNMISDLLINDNNFSTDVTKYISSHNNLIIDEIKKIFETMTPKVSTTYN
jgi:hypothetical protein